MDAVRTRAREGVQRAGGCALSPPPVLSFASGRGEVEVELGQLLETRMLVQGSSRSGKTWALYSMLQETHGRVQHLVIDREADFALLRQRYAYLLVGAEGDIPVDLGEGRVEALVRRVLELRVSVIFDLSDLTPEEQQEYTGRLAHTLAHLPRSSGLWTPALVVVDELAQIAPEAGRGSSVATKPLAALASMGGKRGFCLIGATVALAEVSKSVVRLLENKLIMRTGTNDLERAAKELRLGRDVHRELRSMERGHGYAYGPAIGVDPVLVRIPSELELTPPKRGELRAPPPPAPEAIQALLAAFRDLPVPASEVVPTAAGGSALQEELAQVRREASEAAAALVEIRRALRELGEAPLREAPMRIAGLLVLSEAGQPGTVPEPVALAPVEGGVELAGADSGSATSKGPTTARVSGGAGEGSTTSTLPPAQQGILTTLARFEALGIRGVERFTAAIYSGQSPRSSAYGAHVAELRNKGLLATVPGPLSLTDAGRVAAGAVEVRASLAELHDAWVSYLSAGAGRILRYLVKIRSTRSTGASVSREDLAAAVDMSPRSSAFAAYVASLEKLGLVWYPTAGHVAAGDLLFPGGLI